MNDLQNAKLAFDSVTRRMYWQASVADDCRNIGKATDDFSPMTESEIDDFYYRLGKAALYGNICEESV